MGCHKLTYSDIFSPKIRVLKGGASRPKSISIRKYQWDYIHDPENIVGIFEDDGEGENRSKDERLYDFVQRIRCAFASNRTKIFTSFSLNSVVDFSNISVKEIDFVKARLKWNTTPKGIVSIVSSLPTPTDYHFMEINTKALEYNFGDISLMIPKSNQSEFETFIKDQNFDLEYTLLSTHIKEDKPTEAIESLLNNSYCVYEKLNSANRKYMFKALGEKFILSEEYEDMVLNLIRTSNEKSDSKLIQKDIVTYVLSEKITSLGGQETIFDSFISGMDNFGGKDNYDALIFELSKLYTRAYAIELAEAKAGKCDFYFDWRKTGTVVLNRSNGYLNVQNLVLFGYYSSTSKITDLAYNRIVLVHFAKDFDFINDDNRYWAMPAFLLDFLIHQQVNQLNATFFNSLMNLFILTKSVSALSFLQDASKLQKVKTAWMALSSVLNIALDNNEIKNQIKGLGNGDGEIFINTWEKYQELEIIRGTTGSIAKLFNNETFNLFTELNSSWNVIKTNSVVKNLLDADKVEQEINNLRIIFDDGGIVY